MWDINEVRKEERKRRGRFYLNYVGYK
jgi:hypothetical protein